MKLSCMQENLNKSLKAVIPLSQGRSTLPILSNVLMQTDGGRLKLVTTNLETASTVWMGAKIETEGAITVPAILFSSLVGAMPNERVDLSLEGTTLHITCGASNATLQTITAKDYPPIAEVKGQSFELPADILGEAIRKTLIAAATESSRPILTGVNLTAKGGTLAFAAADGYSLAVYRMPSEGEFNVNVPGRTLGYLMKVLNQEDPVTITISEGKILFDLKTTQVMSSLLEGTFPNYETLIPQDSTTQTTVSMDALSQAMRGASVMARDGKGIVRLIAGTDKLGISAIAGETGDFNQEIPAEVKGEGVKIALANQYMGEILGLFEDKVTLKTSGSSSPAVFSNSENYLYVVMPIFVQW